MKESVFLQPGDRLSLALKSSLPFKVFRSLPSEDLYLMLLDGRDDEVELAIKYATEEQHRDILDFYVWERDEIHPELVMEWLLRILKGCGERKLMHVIARLDPEILIYTFKHYIRVHTLEDPNDPIPEMEDSCSGPRSVDNSFFYYHLQKKGLEAIDAVILHIFSLNYRAYWNLMQGCLHELSMDLMENAYRWRTNRLEDRGFSNFIDSRSIFAGLNREEIESFKKISRPEILRSTASRDGGKVVTHSYFFGLTGVSFLREIFEKMEERQEASGLQGRIVMTMNKLISASLPAMNDIQKIKGCVRKGMETLSLALDYLSSGDLEHAALFLSEIRVETLFRIGNSLIRNLEKDLQAFFSQSSILNRETIFLLGSPRADLVRGLLREPPLFFDGETGLPENFKKREQIELASRTIDEARCLDRLFHDRFNLQLEGLGDLGGRRIFQSDLTFSNLFISGVCNIILKRHFEFVPINASRVEEMRDRGFQSREHGLVLNREYEEELNAWYEALTSDWEAGDRRLCVDLLKTWIGEFCEEFSSLGPAGKIDPRFIRTVLIEAP